MTAADSEARALQLLNSERQRNGLPALALNGGARSVARSWSSYMATHSLGHNPNLARDLERAGVTGWRTIKENVGYGSSADEIHSMLMSSGGHRNIMLSSEVSEVGIGVVSSGGTLWLTMDFIGY